MSENLGVRLVSVVQQIGVSVSGCALSTFIVSIFVSFCKAWFSDLRTTLTTFCFTKVFNFSVCFLNQKERNLSPGTPSF